MALFRKNVEGGIMDAIRCDEQTYLIWKWRPSGAELGESNKENAIRWGSAIRVKEGSVAVFVYTGKEGFVQDYIEGPADTLVDTMNLPIISSIIGKAYHGGTPFQAEVYFINLAETIQTKFAVQYFDVYDYEKSEFSVPIAVRGTIDFHIQDYKEFVKKHRLDDFSIDQLQEKIRDAVIETVKSAILNAPEHYQVKVIHLERRITEIKKDVTDRLREKFYADYGIFLKDISFAGIEIDKESQDYKELLSVTKEQTTKNIKMEGRVQRSSLVANTTLDVLGKAAGVLGDLKINLPIRRKKEGKEGKQKKK